MGNDSNSACISKRAYRYPQSAIRGLGPLASDAERLGVRVIPLNIGAPDMPIPLELRSAGSRFFQISKTMRYGSSAGDGALIAALCRFYRDTLGFSGIEPENLLITQGASEALEIVMYSVADAGDSILVPDPCYSNYSAIAYKYGIHLKPIASDMASGFHLRRCGEDDERLYRRISGLVKPNVKAILWSSPGNPTGVVFSESELRVLLRVAAEHGLVLIADEVYRMLAFNDLSEASRIPRSVSIFDIAPLRERNRIIVLDSLSKSLCFCGGRVGSITASEQYIRLFTNIVSARGCPNTVSQAAAITINDIPISYFEHNRKEILERRDVLHHGLSQLSDIGVRVSPVPPEGAFYIVANLGPRIEASRFCNWLLTDYVRRHKRRETLILTPMRVGTGGFYVGNGGEMGEVRLAYVVSKPLLRRAMRILSDAIPLYLGDIIPGKSGI